MFDIGLPEFAVLAVAALFIFGPERLPQAAAQAAKLLKQVRNMANNARSELTNELGPEFGNLNFEDLNPRTFIRKNLLEGTGLDTLKDDIGLTKSDVSLALDEREPDALEFWMRPPVDLEST
jgi:sec-independent protein translocase protein TatB